MFLLFGSKLSKTSSFIKQIFSKPVRCIELLPFFRSLLLQPFNFFLTFAFSTNPPLFFFKGCCIQHPVLSVRRGFLQIKLRVTEIILHQNQRHRQWHTTTESDLYLGGEPEGCKRSTQESDHQQELCKNWLKGYCQLFERDVEF